MEIDYSKVDAELVNLIQALNSVPGFRTTSCCAGHGEAPPRIWFTVDSIENLNKFMWAGSRRYFAIGYDWKIELNCADQDRHAKDISLLLEGKVFDRVVDAANELAAAIELYVQENCKSGE